ncbi:BLUF domain-containing protein [Mariprofundus erugo]|uniref:BLUF domain-containing protein n=1 Tax=Mariprofundus erugo TaxID=2528639 RepID=A0A5R9GTF6_9PROT|nr:BLUF domain-containing protein [Mariprofundus erugo]TLS67547.1 BLUF domain-containing protein [Mariprofundus erugo]TLS76212.1 BLUF domain-containing protein [Mariprofundus erugo]
MRLTHIIYASKDRAGFTNETVLGLLTKARDNNEALNVTGMLLFDGNSFFQVLEGEETVVSHLFDRISQDKRHYNIVQIVREAIPHRHFSNWSMGYAPVSREDLNSIDGLNDFFDQSTCLADIDEGRAKKLLHAYTKGMWRLH